MASRWPIDGKAKRFEVSCSWFFLFHDCLITLFSSNFERPSKEARCLFPFEGVVIEKGLFPHCIIYNRLLLETCSVRTVMFTETLLPPDESTNAVAEVLVANALSW